VRVLQEQKELRGVGCFQEYGWVRIEMDSSKPKPQGLKGLHGSEEDPFGLLLWVAWPTNCGQTLRRCLNRIWPPRAAPSTT
jgi:hypothetical protein